MELAVDDLALVPEKGMAASDVSAGGSSTPGLADGGGSLRSVRPLRGRILTTVQLAWVGGDHP